MRKLFGISCVALCCGLNMNAQSAIDAYNISQSGLSGTARFMSMGGAFGALGGDLSTLTQNPGGIGVYRSSEIGITLDLNLQSANTQRGNKDSNTFFSCNNFGYIGSVNTGSDVMRYFSWGASYSRKASFDRDYHGYFGSLPNSLSNYIASFSDGYDSFDLLCTDQQNPYQGLATPQGGMIYPDWLSILAYNAYLINSIGNTNRYNGLHQNGTSINSEFSVRERGHIDEYSINFGGNFVDAVYWGVGFGITDLSFSQSAWYDEELQNARVPNYNIDDKDGTGHGTGTVTGNAYFGLDNYKRISGSGFNFKLGVIVKPIESLRIGLAFHTPTWYNLNQGSDANVSYSYSTGYDNGFQETDYSYFEYKMRSPWRFIASVAGVIGGKAIVSLDYEREAFDKMSFSDSWGYNYSDVNGDIRNYFQSANKVRVGVEYRVTPRFSIRAGYANTGSNVKNQAENQNITVYTSGTNPAYTFNTSLQDYACGLGYRMGSWYADLAYVHSSRSSSYHPFTTWSTMETTASIPVAEVKQHQNNIVLSVGYKF